jgi:hypothetical protein
MIALRPVAIHAADYPQSEYAMTDKQMDEFCAANGFWAR